MSNNRTSSVELEVTNDEMKELLDQSETSAPVAKKSKNVFSRILAVLLAVAPIALVCILSMPIMLAANSTYVVQEDITLLKAFLALFSKNGAADLYVGVANAPAEIEKLFGFLPVFTSYGYIGKAFSVAMYLFLLFSVLSVIFMLVAVFSGKKAPCMVRAITFLNVFLYGGYSLAMWAVSKNYGLGNVFNYVLLGVAGVSLLVYIGYAFGRARSKTWLPLLLFILTLAFIGAYVYFYAFTEGVNAAILALVASTEKSIIPALSEGTFYVYFFLAFTAVSVINFFVSFLRVGTKKGLVFDIIRYVFALIFAGFTVYLAFTVDAVKDLENIVLFIAVAAGIALVQLLICCIVKGVSKKKAKKAAEVASEEETVVAEASKAPAEEVEEANVYAEAVSYDYPVPEEDISVAESQETEVAVEEPVAEEEPAAEEAPAPAQSIGYDYYNSKSFDPFIASLNNTEREQFTNIFILKYQGDTKNLPDYEVGGDNTEFFRKVFIFLGQYRDRIPDTLLAKMYQFTIKK